VSGRRALRLSPADNVATALADLAQGEQVAIGGQSVTLAEAIPLCHKLALQPIPAGADIVKYGQRIGRASSAIGEGAHVHVHNMRSARGR